MVQIFTLSESWQGLSDMDHREPLKNLRDVLSSRRFETNASLKATAHKGALAPYGETKQGKADNSPLSKVAIRELPKGIVRDTSHVKLRSSSDKVARELRRNGDNFSDYQDADYSESPRDPAWKAGQAKFATARPNSPFKRAGRSAASVVIVRK